jgi:hypothetical protein
MSRQATLALNLAPAIRVAATFSPCERYRYTLLREWDLRLRRLLWIMLNPSKATAEIDDPTVAKCQRYARAWGFGSIVVTNLFGWRSTDPKALYSVEDPIGPENDAAIFREVRAASKVICAWGKHGALRDRGAEVLASLRAYGVTPYCLSRNNDGSPGHPLYLPAAQTLQVIS